MTEQMQDVPMAISDVLTIPSVTHKGQWSTTINASGLPRKLVTGQVKDVPMAISAIIITDLKNSKEQ